MIVGMDLGTTNSLVAAFRDGRPVLAPNALGSVLTPSCVSVDEDGGILVGRSARDRLVSHPDRTAAAFKRLMGTSREVVLGGRAFRPEELSALVLRALKADAEAHFGEAVTEAVVTVPAYFGDAQRRATRAAGALAGLRVERLLNEPTAAALAYGLADREGRVLVFDLGGGTFDVSVLEMFEGVMEVRATAGDAFLGGEDFTAAIEGWFLDGPGRGLPPRGDARLAPLRRQAELAKRALGEGEAATLSVPWQGGAREGTLTREAFDALAEPLLARLRRPVERALRDARLRVAELDRVVLVGGATRMPAVRRLAARLFGRLPQAALDPDRAVGLGAAVQAGLKARDAALAERVMTDVAPYTLGIETAHSNARGGHDHGHYLPVIERGTTIPASRVERIWPLHEQQRKIEVAVFQGEARRVADNVALGKVEVSVPAAGEGERGVDVRFTYDTNGILEVDATPAGTGRTVRLVIQESPGALSPEEVSRRLAALAALKLHPRERAEARAVLARVDRLYEESLGAERERLSRAVAAYEAVLDRQDPREAERATKDLVALLDALDRGADW